MNHTKKYFAILGCCGLVGGIVVSVALPIDGSRLNIKDTVSNSNNMNTVVDEVGSGTMGALNDVDSRRSIAVGGANDLTGTNSYYQAAFGSYNTISAYQLGGFAAGKYNFVSKNHAAAIGYGVRATNTVGQVVVGVANENDVSKAPEVANAVFVVGSGSSNGVSPDPTFTRENAFIVTEDQDVIVPKPQGDIEMGTFSN